MKKLFILPMLLSVVIFSEAQTVIGGNQASAIDMNTGAYGTISTFGFPEKTTKGSQYLYKTWDIGTVEVNSGIIKDVPLNIDLQNQNVEIKTDKGIRVIPIKTVNGLKVSSSEILSERILVNTHNFNGHKANISGLAEIIVRDKITLLKYSYIYIKEANYNATLDMGNNEVKYLIKSRYFFATKDKMVEVSPSKKKFLDQFSDETKEILNVYLKDKNINVKKEEDIIALGSFINVNEKLTNFFM